MSFIMYVLYAHVCTHPPRKMCVVLGRELYVHTYVIICGSEGIVGGVRTVVRLEKCMAVNELEGLLRCSFHDNDGNKCPLI